MAIVEIPYDETHIDEAPAWWPYLYQTQDGDWRASTYVRCGHGHVSRLDIGGMHELRHDGVVTPSLVCPVDGCDWHENVKLVAWQRRRRQ